MICLKMMKEMGTMIFDECIEKPRLRKVLDEADILLLSSNVATTFPYSMKRFICERTNVKIISSSKAASYGININDFGSEDAAWFRCDENDMIIYNDAILSNQRIRFSLAHECGHIKMSHDLDRKDLYKIYEMEANFFAAQILMPEQIINELMKRGKKINSDNLMLWFNVSKQAADKRIETLRKVDFSRRTQYEKDNDRQLVLKYKKFIDSITPINSYYSDPYEEEEEQRKRDLWY